MANNNNANGVKMTPEMWEKIQADGQKIIERMFGRDFDDFVKQVAEENKKKQG